jgi:site-specific DNA recombinase
VGPKQARREVRTIGVYARRSRQKETFGTKLQLDKCRERADEEGWAVREQTDDGRSGWDPNVRREGYELLLQDIRDGLVDGALIYKADRLTRDDRERRRFEDLYEEAGLWLVALANGKRFDLTTADGKKDFRDAGNASEYSSNILSERMRDHHRWLAEVGKDSGGMRPFGFEPDRTTLREPEAKLLEDAARRVIRGESLRSITTRLNAKNAKTAGGGAWRPSHLGGLLTSPRYGGFRELDGKLIPAVWDAILDRETFDTVSALLADPTRKTAQSTARKHVLSGLVWCGACGTRIYSHNNGAGLRSYRCETGPNHDGCGKVSITGRRLDQYVCEVAYQRVQHIIESAQEPEPVDTSAVDEKQAIENQLRDLGRLFAAKKIGPIEFAAASEELRAQLATFVTAPTPAKPRAAWSNLYKQAMNARAPWEDGFDVADLDDWRSMLLMALERVNVYPSPRRGGRFDAARVEVVWH